MTQIDIDTPKGTMHDVAMRLADRLTAYYASQGHDMQVCVVAAVYVAPAPARPRPAGAERVPVFARGELTILLTAGGQIAEIKPHRTSEGWAMNVRTKDWHDARDIYGRSGGYITSGLWLHAPWTHGAIRAAHAVVGREDHAIANGRHLPPQ